MAKPNSGSPPLDPLQELVAWHAERGVRGVEGLDARPPQEKIELSLIPPEPLRIRVIDPDGKPIGGEELGVEVKAAVSSWAVTSKIEAAHVRTDADGIARVPWAPRESLKYVEVRLISPDWKIDETDLSQVADRVVTVHARHRVPVEGRLVMPAGASPEGLLITGFGFGPRGNNGDRPSIRTRADGTFTLNAPSEHAYALGIVDLEWGGDPWSGVILSAGSAKIPNVTITAYSATPVTVRATQGKHHTPIANAWVDLGRLATPKWTDASGKEQQGQVNISSWWRTDSHGMARAGVGRGKCQVRLSSKEWNEVKTFESSDKLIEVEFHRPSKED